MPLANFNPLLEADFKAYEKVNPNFIFGGHWFSKERFCVCMVSGSRYPLERATKRVVRQPSQEPADTADPLDWEQLQERYEYWRKRFRAQGYKGHRMETILGL